MIFLKFWSFYSSIRRFFFSLSVYSVSEAGGTLHQFPDWESMSLGAHTLGEEERHINNCCGVVNAM